VFEVAIIPFQFLTTFIGLPSSHQRVGLFPTIRHANLTAGQMKLQRSCWPDQYPNHMKGQYQMDSHGTRCRPCKQHIRGFTLIELMITVAVVGILAAIAYPSYQKYLVKSRRASAQATLMDIAQRQQQYLLDARGYAPDLATLNVTPPTNVSSVYTITICQTAASPCVAPGGTPPTFAAIATPIAGTAQANDATLSITNTGVKSPSTFW
jgi:type IV pilus assembly protein PilE